MGVAVVYDDTRFKTIFQAWKSLCGPGAGRRAGLGGGEGGIAVTPVPLAAGMGGLRRSSVSTRADKPGNLVQTVETLRGAKKE